MHYCACNQHRAFLEFDLRVRLQHGWLHRKTWPEEYRMVKQEALDLIDQRLGRAVNEPQKT
jgi:hypothetical protein